LAEIPFTIPEARVTAILRRHRLTQIDAVSVGLLGLSLRRWRTADARSATAIVSELGSESALARVQPNYLFKPATEAPAVAPVKATLTAEQYALVKMKVAPSLENPDSAPIRVAVIDTDIDDSHRDLKGVVAERFDAIGEGRPVRLRKHGTEMAGGIAADGQLRGVATRVKILSARAFDGDDSGEARGTTLSIVKALDWSAEKKAQVVNMSFAGPQDPAMHDALARAYALGIALVGAAGNMGPTGPAQYPGADPNVIAATATDENDRLFSHANVGAYVAIAAPGVDVLLPAPDDDYAMESGTSVSCALVTGVVALILEHQPRLGPADIRQRLTATAEPIGGGARSNEFGAGLVDAAKAVAR
jgi:subtilisin family serine protease